MATGYEVQMYRNIERIAVALEKIVERLDRYETVVREMKAYMRIVDSLDSALAEEQKQEQ